MSLLRLILQEFHRNMEEFLNAVIQMLEALQKNQMQHERYPNHREKFQTLNQLFQYSLTCRTM